MKTARLSLFSTVIRTFGVLCVFGSGVILGVTPAIAQEAQEAVEVEIEAPAAEIDINAVKAEETAVPVTFDPALDEPLTLLPESELPTAADGAGFFDTAPTGIATADRLRAAIKIRELKTISLREPEIIAQRELARDAKTYEGRRTALRNYYTLLSRSIIKKDATLKEPVEVDLAKKLADLEQDEIRPSVLIEAIEPVPGSRPAPPVAVVVEEVVKPVKKKGAE